MDASLLCKCEVACPVIWPCSVLLPSGLLFCPENQKMLLSPTQMSTDPRPQMSILCSTRHLEGGTDCETSCKLENPTNSMLVIFQI